MIDLTVEQADAPRHLFNGTFVGGDRGDLAARGAIFTAALLLAISLWLATLNLNDVRKACDISEHMLSTLTLSQTLLLTLTDAETGQRGYLLTGDVNYLRPYQAARARWRADLNLLQGQPALRGQGPALQAIQRLATEKMNELSETVALASAGKRDAALSLVRTNEGERVMDRLRVAASGLNPDIGGEWRRRKLRAVSIWPRFTVVAMGALASSVLMGWGVAQRRARRKATISLAALERFTSAFGQSQGLLRATDGSITFWARGMERLYGYTASQAIGRSSDELLNTQYSTSRKNIQFILEREGHWEGDVFKRHADGRALHVATQWTLHKGALNHADFIIVFDNDISERRRAERQVEQSSGLLRTIVETAPRPIYAKDRDGRMLLANAGTLHLIGKGWAEVEGLTDLDWLPSAAQALVVMANDRRIMETGQVEELQELVEDREGVAKVWLSTKTPIRGPHGQVNGLVGVSVDITELKQRSDQMARLNAELSEALTEPTAALQQRDLLLREVYHRVKNNLQIIDGFIVMQARQMGVEGKAALLSLRTRLHALALVHHQLMHSKNLRTFDIAPFIQEVAGNILEAGGGDVQISVNAISLEVDLDFAIPLGLLVAELVTNSLKHAFPSGKGAINVSLKHAGEGTIALVVSDDGRGRVEGDAATRKSGLGVSIINGLVNQLQGELTMRNDLGAWTEIRGAAPVVA